eukprot:TRINITY_DN7781_c0_g3_i1.p1 TRINITY_DN7781_c0_g3~~TRINITY_DN7781_c0_g3_i1.p1  ORF type:complete len:579 (-),score=100.80 TRINITY_DN7781_c0_g3_i1:93-1829(-)
MPTPHAAIPPDKDALPSLLHRLLAEERERLSELICESNAKVVDRLRSHLVVRRQGASGEMLPFVELERTDPKPACFGGRSAEPNCLKETTSLLPDRLAVAARTAPGELAVQSSYWGAAKQQVAEADLCETSLQKESTDATGSVTQTTTSSRTKRRTIRTDAVFLERSRAKRLVNNPVFESVFACLILFNAICMAMEQQYHGIGLGYKLDRTASPRPAEEAWPHAEATFVVLETFFGVVFTVEVFLKLAVFRLEFVSSWWNIYDAVIVFCWAVQGLSLLNVLINPTVLRLARIGRLLRLLRFAKTFQVFDVLHLLVRSMQACMSALMWSALFLVLVMLATAILLVFLIQPEIENEAIPLEERLKLYRYFGTSTKALFSMYELTMANWVPIARTVVDNLSEWYMVFFMVYRTIVGFAVLKVITAIFNAETFRVTQSDDNIMLLHKERQIGIHTRRMQQLLDEGDDSEDGVLSLEEFKAVMSDRRVQKWLVAQDIELKDIELAFKMLDDNGDRRISPEELVRGLHRLKGAARSVDVMTLMHAFSQLEVLINSINETCEGRLGRVSDKTVSSSFIETGSARA